MELDIKGSILPASHELKLQWLIIDNYTGY